MDEIICGDCLEIMDCIADRSADMILCDLPYEATSCSWDVLVPFELLWKHYKRIIKPNGAIVLTASQPFTTKLIASNYDMFKYTLVWKKNQAHHYAQAPYRFLSEHEDICVFSYGGTSKNAKNRMKYNPQGTEPCAIKTKGRTASAQRPGRATQQDYMQTTTNYPRSVLEFDCPTNWVHSCQKPVALFEYLIRTYTNEGEVVLDNCLGSGTTAIATIRTGRHYIGIELEQKYCEIARERVKLELSQPDLF